MANFICENGTETVSLPASPAFLIAVMKFAMGSEDIGVSVLPRRLFDARDKAIIRQFAEADTA